MKARLFAPFGPLAGLDLTTEAAVTLGSAGDSGVVIPGRTISSRHACLSPDATTGDWLLEDLGSTNGTELDGMQVEGPERLNGLHVIDLAGAVTLFFLPLSEAAPPTALPRPTWPVDLPEPRVPASRRQQAAAVAPPPPGKVSASAEVASPPPEAGSPPPRRVSLPPQSPTVLARREIHLEVRARGMLLRRYTLKEGRNLVGRSVLADVRLERDDISREHSMIEVSRETITVEDLGSTNGTFVDGKEAEKAIAVSEQSDIRFGGVRAKLMIALLD